MAYYEKCYDSPGAYIDRVRRSKEKYLGIKPGGLTKQERKNREELNSKKYFYGGEQQRKEIRSKAFTRDLKRYI